MERESQTLVNNAHDQFFRTAMVNKRVAREFLQAHLPSELCNRIDFEKLIMKSRSFINDIRKESTVDVLFQTFIEGKETYLYILLEHQSTPDELMPFRLLKYICNIVDEHLKNNKTKKIPLIYPIVVYHGERPYPFSTDLNDLVDAPRELVDQYFLKPFQLTDLAKIEDESLKQRAWSGAMEFALKHIFARDILPFLKEITGAFHQIDKEGGVGAK